MKILVVDCCIRKEKSATRKLLESYIAARFGKVGGGESGRAAGAEFAESQCGVCEPLCAADDVACADVPEIERVYLTEEKLMPLTVEDVDRRQSLLDAGKLDDPMFRYAKQFSAVDEILIAAPYWDWSFPSLLKVYMEHVSVSGITFVYRGPSPTGLCKAKRIRYFSTCGGFTEGPHEGVAYIRRIGKAFGINEVLEYTIEGLDIDPAKRDEVLAAGIARFCAQWK
ncbi:MAG: NAD(P)H-dependent oxidoreductase [Treponemataceae bacterium]|nr:NAD(P)H-dependent oxidoreductase [Treponemataceae bacterium]